MIAMHQGLDPIWPIAQLAVQGHLDAFIGVDDGSDGVTDDEHDHDGDEHHGHAVVPAMKEKIGESL